MEIYCETLRRIIMIANYIPRLVASMGEKPLDVLDRRLSILMGFLHVLGVIKQGATSHLLKFFQGGQTASKLNDMKSGKVADVLTSFLHLPRRGIFRSGLEQELANHAWPKTTDFGLPVTFWAGLAPPSRLLLCKMMGSALGSAIVTSWAQLFYGLGIVNAV
jgi:hypothetical protein